MEEQIFEFDVEKSEQRRRKVYIRRMCLIPFFMVLMYFLMPEEPLGSLGLFGNILIPIFVTIGVEIIFFYLLKHNPYAIKKMTLEFLEDRLLVIRDKTKEEIIYSDIIKYKVYKTKENEIKYIDLITNESIIRIWYFINMDEFYLQLKGKLENEQEQIISTFNKLIQNLRAILIIALFFALMFLFRYYKFEYPLYFSYIFFYTGLVAILFKRKPHRAIEYQSNQFSKYTGIIFLILSLGMLIAYILTTKF